MRGTKCCRVTGRIHALGEEATPGCNPVCSIHYRGAEHFNKEAKGLRAQLSMYFILAMQNWPFRVILSHFGGKKLEKL